MRVIDSYKKYLNKFPKTFPVRDFADDNSLEGVALRHDVDISLKAALAMARVEADRGCRSTYFLLNTTTYWDAEDFDESCQELEALGHEIGFHINALAEWYSGDVDSIDDRIEECVSRLRATGVRVNGVAAHGDRMCYQGSLTNYWMFKELRSSSERTKLGFISAEGIVDNRKEFRIPDPVSEVVTRPDGASYNLWGTSMERFGLDYHSVHVSHDRYFSDSGGNWTRTDDPYDQIFQKGRWQVLVHPEYWISAPRVKVCFNGATEAGDEGLQAPVHRIAISAESQNDPDFRRRQWMIERVDREISDDIKITSVPIWFLFSTGGYWYIFLSWIRLKFTKSKSIIFNPDVFKPRLKYDRHEISQSKVEFVHPSQPGYFYRVNDVSARGGKGGGTWAFTVGWHSESDGASLYVGIVEKVPMAKKVIAWPSVRFLPIPIRAAYARFIALKRQLEDQASGERGDELRRKFFKVCNVSKDENEVSFLISTFSYMEKVELLIHCPPEFGSDIPKVKRVRCVQRSNAFPSAFPRVLRFIKEGV